jgi:hypothetical protein
LSDQNTEKKSSKVRNNESTQLSVRIPNEIYDKLDPNNKAESLKFYLEKGMNTEDEKQLEEITANEENQIYRANCPQLLMLFQRNASKLDITEEERMAAKNILELLKKHAKTSKKD